MSRAALFALAAASAAASAPAPPLRGPPQLRGVQGMDDQTVVLALQSLGAGGAEALTERYAALARELQPGLRRYNAFWSAAEGRVPPSITPLECPSGSELVPQNEAERLRLGYAHFHCYDSNFLAGFDDAFARDASVGASSALIVYGSPDWAIDSNCTGFPWPPNPNYRSGCIPWGFFSDWQDYILMLTSRWSAPWGSGQARLSHLCIWNEVQSQGWSDPSPVLPNRYSGQPYSPAQLAQYAGAIGSLMLGAGRGAALGTPPGGVPPFLWLSTDHFNLAPPLKVGDVMHVGLWELLDALWPIVNVTYAWGICVLPYDAGDPRQNLTAQGVYTFVTLRESVAAYQCGKLVQYAGATLESCWEWPQVQMWASEQGWPLSKTMNRTLQARNICLAHGLSVAQGVYAVSHNFFQSNVPTSQGGGGDYSLVDEPPVVYMNLTNAPGHETYDAYASTAPGVFGVTSDHYCCTRWGAGCVPGEARGGGGGAVLAAAAADAARELEGARAPVLARWALGAVNGAQAAPGA